MDITGLATSMRLALERATRTNNDFDEFARQEQASSARSRIRPSNDQNLLSGPSSFPATTNSDLISSSEFEFVRDDVEEFNCEPSSELSGSPFDILDWHEGHFVESSNTTADERLCRSLDATNYNGTRVNRPQLQRSLGTSSTNLASQDKASQQTNNSMDNKTDLLKTKFLSAWTNVRNGWVVKTGTNFKVDSPIWLLGVKYCLQRSEPDDNKRKVEQTMSRDDRTTLEQFKLDFRSRMWLTYRQEFPPLNPTHLTSDVGWGCMIRSGQMLLAHTLVMHSLGRDWRITEARTERLALHRKIIQYFGDSPSPLHPLSIHNITACGLRLGKNPGDWYGPSSVALVLRDALTQASSLDDDLLSSLTVHVSIDGTVYIEDVIDTCVTSQATSTAAPSPNSQISDWDISPTATSTGRPAAAAAECSKATASPACVVSAAAASTHNRASTKAVNLAANAGADPTHDGVLGYANAAEKTIPTSRMACSTNTTSGSFSHARFAGRAIPTISAKVGSANMASDGAAAKISSTGSAAAAATNRTVSAVAATSHTARTAATNRTVSAVAATSYIARAAATSHTARTAATDCTVSAAIAASNISTAAWTACGMDSGTTATSTLAANTTANDTANTTANGTANTAEGEVDGSACMLTSTDLPGDWFAIPTDSKTSSIYSGASTDSVDELSVLSSANTQSYPIESSCKVAPSGDRKDCRHAQSSIDLKHHLNHVPIEQHIVSQNRRGNHETNTLRNSNPHCMSNVEHLDKYIKVIECSSSSSSHNAHIQDSSMQPLSSTNGSRMLPHRISNVNHDVMSESNAHPIGRSLAANRTKDSNGHSNQLKNMTNHVQEPKESVNQQHRTANSVKADEQWRSLLLLIPVRLGGATMNAAYWSGLKNILMYDMCVGIIGGRPKHSLYFIGWQDDWLLHLDPHCCQDTVDVKQENFPLETYHCPYPRKLLYTKMDPSCAIGFYCKTRADFERLIRESPSLTQCSLGDSYSLFKFEEGRRSDAERDMATRLRNLHGNASLLRDNRRDSARSEDFMFI